MYRDNTYLFFFQIKPIVLFAHRLKEFKVQAIIYHQFGGADQLKIEDVAVPELKKGEVRVQVKSVSINPLDWKIRGGAMKLMSGSSFPKGIGVDFSGIVEDVAADVTAFNKGDAVFGAVDGMKQGALREYVSISADAIWHKPDALTFSQAAALPVVGTAAYQALFKLAKVGQGNRVLINGATGGVGMVAVQLAHQAGAHVTAVAGSSGLPLAKQWGADQLINYSKTNVLNEGQQFDTVFDLSGKLPFQLAQQVMAPNAVFINPVPDLKQIVFSKIHNLFSAQKHQVLLSVPHAAAIGYVLQAIDNGMQMMVGRTFPFDQAATAYREAERGGAIGKITIEISGE